MERALMKDQEEEYPTAKVSEWRNRNVPARNTLVQVSALYTGPESHNAQRYV